MKKIHLIRHAKSSWADISLSDIERPLNDRGISTCRLMAEHIYKAGCIFDNVFSSPAVRARSTIEIIADCLEDMEITWETEEDLYTFSSDSLIEWCRNIDESMSEIVMVGHNPAFTDFANRLGRSRIDNIPTCGYVQMQSENECLWHEIPDAPFKINTFLRPKKLIKDL